MQDPNDLNDTAKFDLNVNQKMMEEKAEKEKLINNVEKCPICNEVISNKKFLDHLGNKHMGNHKKNIKDALDILEGKVRDLRFQCSQIYLVHYWLLMSIDPQYQPSQAQKDKYVKIRKDASNYYSSAFSDEKL